MLCMIFLMYLTTLKCLNYAGQEPRKHNLQFNVFNTHVTLKQRQGHQTWYGLVDPKKDYNHAKFERPH